MREALFSCRVISGLLAVFLLPVSFSLHAEDSLIDLVSDGKRVPAIAAIESGNHDVNEVSVDGTTALHWAVYRNDRQLVNLLLQAGADPNAANDYGASPMSTAAEIGDTEIMMVLLDAGGDVDSPNAEGQTLLMAVARTGNTDTARLLLERGADIDARENWGGQTALMWAASRQHPAMVKLLVESGADIDTRSREQQWDRYITSEPRIKPQLHNGAYTALLYAAREGCEQCAEFLLDAGADIDKPDLWGRTPLIMALENLHYDLAAILIERGADMNRFDWWGRTPLYSAIDLNRLPRSRRGDLPTADSLTAIDLARMLLDRGADPNMRLKQEPPFRSDPGDRGYTDGSPDSRVLNGGATALHKAAKEGDVDAVRLLLEHGARVDVANRVYGVTPILTAAGVWRNYGIFMDDPISGVFKTEAEVIEIIDLLLAAGADIHERATNGQGVAHGAAEAGWNDVLAHLQALGVDFSQRDIGGRTPRDLALARGLDDTVAVIDRLGGETVAGGLALLPQTGSLPEDTEEAILAALPEKVTAATALPADISAAAMAVVFSREGELEARVTDVTIALGQLAEAGVFTGAPRMGPESPVVHFYNSLINLTSSHGYGTTPQYIIRVSDAMADGINQLNEATP